jgi:hypothetical protein
MQVESGPTRRDILMVTSATLATAGLPAAMAAPARAQSPTQGTKPTEPPAEIMALINTALEAFNRKDAAVFNSVFGGDVVIVDGFAPFRWIGPDALARWWADAETWGKAGGVVKEHISFDGIRRTEVSGTRGYAVLFRDTYDHAESGPADNPTGYPCVHVRKARRCVEG